MIKVNATQNQALSQPMNSQKPMADRGGPALNPQGDSVQPFMSRIDAVRAAGRRGHAVVGRQESIKTSMLTERMWDGLQKIQGQIERIDGLRKEASRRALFGESRHSYQDDLVHLKNQIDQSVYQGFKEYLKYQKYYGFFDYLDSDHEEINDSRPMEIRLALGPLASRVNSLLSEFRSHVQGVDFGDSLNAQKSEQNIKKAIRSREEVEHHLSYAMENIGKISDKFRSEIVNGSEKIHEINMLKSKIKTEISLKKFNVSKIHKLSDPIFHLSRLY